MFKFRWLQIFYALSYLSETFKEMSSDWKELSWVMFDIELLEIDGFLLRLI